MVNGLEPLKKGKLTKKFLMDIEEDLYLVSNVHPSPLQSIYADKVASPDMREYQWRQIVEVEANNRVCYVFSSKEDYQKYFNGPIVDMLMEGAEKT